MYANPVKNKTLKEVGSGYTYFADNDLLLAKVTPCFENGKLGIARKLENGIGFGSSEYIVLRTDNVILLSEYLYYALFSNMFRENGKKHMLGACGLKRLSKDYVLNYKLPLPPLEEQQRIVNLLNSAFAKIDVLKAISEQNLQNARDLFQASLRKALTPKEGWEIKKIREIGELKYGYTEKSSLEKIGPKFLRITDIHDNSVDWTNVPYCKCDDLNYDKYKLEVNDIVFARTGATTGKSFLIEALYEDAVFASYLIRLKLNTTRILPAFLMYFFNSDEYWKVINEGISGSAQGGFNAGKLSELILKLPSLSEQQQIVEKLDAFSKRCKVMEKNYRQTVALTQDLKQALLKQAFNGEL